MHGAQAADGGEMMRDFTFIDDVAAGVIAAMDNVRPSGPGAQFQVFNLGNSHPEPVTQLVRLLEEHLGRQAVVEHPHGMPLGDVSATWANVSLANELLGWRPTTSLEQGVRRFSQWYARVLDAWIV